MILLDVFGSLIVAATLCVAVADGQESTDAVDQLSPFLQTSSIAEVAEQAFANKPLSKSEALRAMTILTDARTNQIRDATAVELENRVLKIGELEMPFWFETYGDAPADGHSLYISMHGGGGAPKRVNDQQWKNQQRLYRPEEGVYVAPRAPTDTWDLWHQSHIDKFFDRMIEMMVAHLAVNPNRVYLMGYSAGGDGVYQLAPRMADRLAAASMMAGHPNDASPLGLRNIGFALFMGGKDAAYNRNQVAAEWKEKLAELQKNDPGGYQHEVTIYPEYGHWMQGDDAAAIPWMAKFSRIAWPERVVWMQDDVRHVRFYWLQVEPIDALARRKIVASYSDATIQLETDGAHSVTLLLSDEMANLDQPITVIVDGKSMRGVSAQRTIGAMARSISSYGIARPIPVADVVVSTSQ